ncbi:MAG: hypothetical protein JRN35_07035 [Nitrososphaerota archaeon]|nr:hypothetical protein [Nitrososphaerota archaeon]
MDSERAELLRIFDALDSFERDVRAEGEDSNDWPETGVDLAVFLEHGHSEIASTDYNLIPSDTVHGCRRTLVVCIGRHDDVEERIKQAENHLANSNCGETTETLVFWAAMWDSGAWWRHARSFKGTTPWLVIIHGGKGQLSLP